MHFTKMHGIGNDYVYVNGFADAVDEPEKLAPVISDRHRGVGADGLILLLPPAEGVDADVRMRMYNADGSEAEMCGNGIRCLCKLAHDRGLSRANPMRVQTPGGVLSLAYELDDPGKVSRVSVNMGEPILDTESIPVRLEGLSQVIAHSTKNLFTWPEPHDWMRQADLDQRMTCVSMGNPHAVMFCRDVEAVPLERVGPMIEHHRVFPNRINAHFVKVHSEEEVTMRTWERGSGITQACGTGACAVAVAGALTGRTGPNVLAHLPGGDLELDWDANTNQVTMTGPAEEVFTGEWPGSQRLCHGANPKREGHQAAQSRSKKTK